MNLSFIYLGVFTVLAYDMYTWHVTDVINCPLLIILIWKKSEKKSGQKVTIGIFPSNISWDILPIQIIEKASIWNITIVEWLSEQWTKRLLGNLKAFVINTYNRPQNMDEKYKGKSFNWSYKTAPYVFSSLDSSLYTLVYIGMTCNVPSQKMW